MLNTLLLLKTTLPAQDFIVTGSYVLQQYGLMSNVADLDIILVKPEPSTIETINRFMKEFTAPSTAKLKALDIPEKTVEEMEVEEVHARMGKPLKVAKAQPSVLHGIFICNKIKVDVFIEDDFSEPTLLIDGIKHTTILHIVQAKRSYGRMKDWLQCKDMANKIFDPIAFSNMLRNNWKDALRNDYPDK